MGHTVLALPVAPLDDVVRARTEFYDASFVSSDPGFVHAHITVLGPWVRNPQQRDLDVVAGIARSTPPLTFTFDGLEEFPDGLIHLPPRPDQPIRDLTARLARAFPDHPPYEGRFPDPIPHLTLDRLSEDVDMASVARTVAHLLPLHIVVDRLDLQWWANDDCRLVHSWPLAGPR